VGVSCAEPESLRVQRPQDLDRAGTDSVVSARSSRIRGSRRFRDLWMEILQLERTRLERSPAAPRTTRSCTMGCQIQRIRFQSCPSAPRRASTALRRDSVAVMSFRAAAQRLSSSTTRSHMSTARCHLVSPLRLSRALKTAALSPTRCDAAGRSPDGFEYRTSLPALAAEVIFVRDL